MLKTLIALIPMITSASQAAEHRPLFSSENISPFSYGHELNNENGGNNSDAGTSLPYASQMNQAARMLANGNATDTARSLVSSQVSGAVQGWLSQFGTARLQINTDRHGSWGHSAADLLAPLYDNQQSILFAQGGIRKPSDRLTGNLGAGVRTFWQNGWMYGGNVFFDRDFTGINRRVGIGGEAWADYLRLSANTYIGTSQWHTSRDFDGTWQEKPADGYDVRAEGWLPAYPQLGMKLMWEQYYGNQVALFDKDHLQHNPYAITAGVEYTPLPLVTVGVDQKQGAGEHDTQVELNFRWTFGQNWQWQTDPENVRSFRTLNGSRYELVNRNNEIALQYRKSPDHGVAHLTETVITDNSPADGVTCNSVQVLATNDNGQPVSNAPVSWSTQGDGSAALSVATAVTDTSGLAFVTLTSTKVQTVPVNAQSGSISASQNIHFVGASVSNITLAVTQDNVPADGVSQDVLVATLTGSNDHPVTGQKVTWVTPENVTAGESEAVSDNSGKVTLHFASTVAAGADIRVMAGSQSASQTIHFKGNAASAKVNSLTVTTDGSPADGKTANEAQAVITDASGNPLSGQTVTWKSDKPTVTFGQSAATDSNGQSTVPYTDTTAESLTLTATLSNGNDATASSLFVSDKDSARLKDLTVTSGAKASGTDTNTATVTVTDASGNALANIPVTFSSTGSAKVSNATVNTDSNGKVQVMLTDTEAETVQVTAKLATGSSMTKDSSFLTDLDNAVLTATATTGALSDGKATNTVTVTLKDNHGKAISGEAVTLKSTGSAKLSAASGATNGNGQSAVTLTDTVSESVTITATLTNNGKTATTQAAFIAYSVTALTTSASSLKADGSTPATLTATVKDSSGTIVANAPVSFSVTGAAALSTTTVNTNSSGQAQVTLTDSTGESVTVTAKAKDNSSDVGKTQNVTFVAPSITDIGVYGTNNTFSAGQGFPQTGFAGARFYFLIDSSTDKNGSYAWSSNRSWITVDNNGGATMKATQSSTINDFPPLTERQVTITAAPKAGGHALTYTFTLQKWYTRSPVRSPVNRDENYASSACNGFQNATIESASELTEGAVSVVGKLFGEWRDSPSLAKYSFYWDAETSATWRAGEDIAFIYSSGLTDSASQPGATYVMCRVN